VIVLSCSALYLALRHLGLLNLGVLLALLGLALLEMAAALLALLRRRVARAHWQGRSLWLGFASTALLGALLGWASMLSTFANDLPPDERESFGAQLCLVAALAVLASALPRARRLGPSLARGTLVALLGLELAWQERPLPPAVELTSPFAGAALVMHGGPSPLTNHHALAKSQTHALDLLSAGERGPHDCWGTPLLAPASGVVTSVVQHLPDSASGKPELASPAGNHLLIETKPGGPYVLLAHLQQGSVRVAVGTPVQRGDELARCGNSGNSTQPHLHLQVQLQPSFDANADLETLPIRFVGISRTRCGVAAKGSFFVRRNDVFDPLGKP
jgi:hypothetical protein